MNQPGEVNKDEVIRNLGLRIANDAVNAAYREAHIAYLTAKLSDTEKLLATKAEPGSVGDEGRIE